MQIFICDDEAQMLSEISHKVQIHLPDSQVSGFTKAGFVKCLGRNKLRYSFAGY